jgi:hypothetical protein
VKTKTLSHRLLVAGGALLLLAGCGKKEAAAPSPGPDQTAVQPAQPEAAATPAPAAAPDSRLTESQTALAARDYDRAAEALIALQRTQLNEQQAAAAAAQMRQLQSSLAGAVAGGDPKAIAAAQRLRQASMVH